MSPDRCTTCRGLDTSRMAAGEKCIDCGRVQSTTVSCPSCGRQAAAAIEVDYSRNISLTCLCGDCFDPERGAAEQARTVGWSDRQREVARASFHLLIPAFREIDGAISYLEGGITGAVDPWQRIHQAQREGRDVIDSLGEQMRPRDHMGQDDEQIAAHEDKETIEALMRGIGQARDRVDELVKSIKHDNATNEQELASAKQLLSESEARNRHEYERGFAMALDYVRTELHAGRPLAEILKAVGVATESDPEPKINCPKCGGDKWASFDGPGDASTVTINCLCGYSFHLE